LRRRTISNQNLGYPRDVLFSSHCEESCLVPLYKPTGHSNDDEAILLSEHDPRLFHPSHCSGFAMTELQAPARGAWIPPTCPRPGPQPPEYGGLRPDQVGDDNLVRGGYVFCGDAQSQIINRKSLDIVVHRSSPDGSNCDVRAESETRRRRGCGRRRRVIPAKAGIQWGWQKLKS
jgi:hypothetical protein